MGKPDLMIPIFIKDYLPHGIIGLLVVTILSARMSSLSSAINSLSAATTEDFIIRGRAIKPETYLRYSGLMAVLWGCVCILIAFFAENIAGTVIEVINKIGSVFFGPIIATFIIATSVPSIKGKSMNIGLILGVMINIYFWLFLGDDIFWFWWNAIGAFSTLSISFLTSRLIKENKQPIQKVVSTYKNKDLLHWHYIVLLGYFMLMIYFSYLIPKVF